MEIVLVRHFQTSGNLKKQYIGKTDEPLAEVVGMLPLIDRRRRDCRGTAQIIASPMQRCIQTAELLFPGKSLVVCEKMRECDFGDFEGKSYEELKTNQAYQAWMDSGGKLPFPRGEDHEAFKHRCVEGFCEMVDMLITEKIEKASIVVHGGTIMAILSNIDSQKRAFYHWQLENGGGYRIVLDENAWIQGKTSCREIQKL